MIVVRKLSEEEARKYFPKPGRPKKVKADKKAFDPDPQKPVEVPKVVIKAATAAMVPSAGECFVAPSGEHFFSPAIVGRSVITEGMCSWCGEGMEQPEGWKPYRS